MKKSLIFLLFFYLSLPLFAAEKKVCGYTDFFHLSEDANPRIIIVRALSDGDVYLRILGYKSFEILDGDNCHSGYAHITYAADLNHWCLLDIKDGPYMLHPTVYASCQGLVYNGISYDGINSYSYTINFS